MAWSSAIGSTSWTGGTRKYKSISEAISSSPAPKAPKTSSSGGGSASKKVTTEVKTGGGGASRSIPIAKTAPPVSAPPQGGVSGDLSRYVPPSERRINLPGYGYRDVGNVRQYYDVKGKVVAAEVYLKPKAPAPTQKVMYVVDAQGRPTTKYTLEEKRVTAQTEVDARSIGQRAPGMYDVQTLTRTDLPQASGGGAFRPSLTPLLTASLEGAAGRRPEMVNSTMTREKSILARRNTPAQIFGREYVTTTATYQTTTGAQSQVAMLASGKSFGEAYKAGFAPVQYTVEERKSVPSQKWLQVRETFGWRFLTDAAAKGGARLEYIGAGIQGTAATRAASSNALVRAYGRVEGAGGKAYAFTGQWLGGLGKTVREEPVLAARDVAIGAAAAYAGGALSGAATVGGTAAKLGSFAFKGAGAFLGGYFAASEVDAIRKAERPGERAARTTIELAALGVGASIGSALAPKPVFKGVRFTSQQGVLIDEKGFASGTIQRRGVMYAEWRGKTRRVPFSSTEEYFGGGVKGTVQFRGGERVPFEVASTMAVRPDPRGFTRARSPVGTQSFIYEPRGVERMQAVEMRYNAANVRYTSNVQEYLGRVGVSITQKDFSQSKGLGKDWLGYYRNGRVFLNTQMSAGDFDATLRHEAIHAYVAERYGSIENVPAFQRMVKSPTPEQAPYAELWLSNKNDARAAFFLKNEFEEVFAYSREAAPFKFSYFEKQPTKAFLVWGDVARPGLSGSFAGVVGSGRGKIVFNPRQVAPRGLLTYAAGEPATMFRPGGFAGFSTGAPAAQMFETVALPGMFAPGFPSVGAYGGALTGARQVSVFGVPSVASQQKSFFTARSVAAAPALVGAKSMSVTLSNPVLEPGVSSVSDLVSVSQPATSSVTDVVSISKLTGVTGAPPGAVVTPSPVPVPPFVPFFPEAGFPGFGFGAGKKSAASYSRLSFKTRYNPSIVGATFNIRGTLRQGRRAALTGVTIRPIVG